jgi:hypothetical protein
MAQVNERAEPHLEAPLLERLHKYVLWSAFIVGVCLAAFGWLSTLSRLKFVLDSLVWSIDRIPPNLQAILQVVGHNISEAVSGYRELVAKLVRVLQLPKMRPIVYDVIAIAFPSAGLGYQLGMKNITTLRENLAESDALRKKYEKRWRRRWYKSSQSARKVYDEHYEENIQPFWLAQYADRLSNFLNGTVGYLLPWGLADRVAAVIFYGAVVSSVVAGLFGIDYLYRHFA